MDGGGARVRAVNRAPVVGDAGHLLYWTAAARRVRFEPGLERVMP